MTNTAINAKQPTLADVRRVTAESNFFPEPKRRKIDNALRTIWRYTGRPLEEIPATIPALREVFNSIEPAAHGVKREQITNTRNLVMHAGAKSGLMPALEGYRQRHEPLSQAWKAFCFELINLKERTNLSALVGHLNDRGISPQEFDNHQFTCYREHFEATSLRDNQHDYFRKIARYWNDVRLRCPALKLPAVDIPDSKLRRLPLALSDLPTSFQKDLKDYATWASQDDDFALDARARILSKSTVEGHVRAIHRFAFLLVKDGFPVEKITDLGVLVSPENFRRGVTTLHEDDKSEQRTTTYQTAVTLIRIGKERLGLPEVTIAQLMATVRKLKKPEMVMTQKNKLLVAKYDKPETLKRLCDAPEKIVEAAKQGDMSNWRTMAKLQAAMALKLLVNIPLRLNNLTNLKFDEHIILNANGVSSIFLTAQEMKGKRALEFDIPQDLAAMMIWYRNEICPKIMGKRPSYLFGNPDDSVKGFAGVRYLIQKYFKDHVGFHMNPHAFRHLCAKIILDADPGAHVQVQELLGHGNLETAVAYYAGLNSRRAGRHHQSLIAKALRGAETHARRPLAKEKA